MLSPIQLEEHRIIRVHFDTHTDEGEVLSPAFRHAVIASKQNNQHNRWLVRLDVEFFAESETVSSPYSGKIAVAGVFSLPDDFPEEKASDMVHMNGGAILYGTAREILSSLSSRGIYGSIILPTVDARCFLPKPAKE